MTKQVLITTALILTLLGTKAQNLFSMRGGAALPVLSFYDNGYPILGNMTFDYVHLFDNDSANVAYGLGWRSRINFGASEDVTLINGDDYSLSTFDVGLALTFGAHYRPQAILSPYWSVGIGYQGYFLSDSYKDYFSEDEYDYYSNSILSTWTPMLDFDFGVNLRLSPVGFMNFSVGYLTSFRSVEYMAVNTFSYQDGIIDYRVNSDLANQIFVQLGFAFTLDFTNSYSSPRSNRSNCRSCCNNGGNESNTRVIRRQQRRENNDAHQPRRRGRNLEYSGKTPVLR
jgi:hypothetical protein